MRLYEQEVNHLLRYRMQKEGGFLPPLLFILYDE